MSSTGSGEEEDRGVVTSLDELVGLRSDASRLGHPPIQRARHALAGPYLSAFRGGGIEFDEVRAYQAGDDMRCIDWRVTARTGRPHSRVFREERERPVWLGVDLAPPMHFGTRCAFKSVLAARAAALLAWSAHDRGDRVGAVIRSSAGIGDHPVNRTDLRFLGVLASLAEATRAHGGEASEGFDESLERVAFRAQAGCQTYLLSDFTELGERGRESLALLARRTDLTCLSIYDRLEAIAPPAGRYRISNGRDHCSITTGSRAFTDTWCDDFAVRRAEMTEFCQSHRIGLVTLATDDDLLEVLASPGLPPGEYRKRRPS